MKDIKQGMFNALKDLGVVADGWRINIIGITPSIGDWATVSVEVIKPRCRKPCMVCECAVHTVYSRLDWERSSWAYLD